MANKEEEPLNEQPNLLDLGFPEERRDIDPGSTEHVSDKEADKWFKSLKPVPPEDRPRVRKLIRRALDEIKIISGRQKPSKN